MKKFLSLLLILALLVTGGVLFASCGDGADSDESTEGSESVSGDVSNTNASEDTEAEPDGSIAGDSEETDGDPSNTGDAEGSDDSGSSSESGEGTDEEADGTDGASEPSDEGGDKEPPETSGSNTGVIESFPSESDETNGEPDDGTESEPESSDTPESSGESESSEEPESSGEPESSEEPETPEEPEETASEGLEFTLMEWEDPASYYVSGIGTCTDTTIVIPSTYNGLPVTMIEDLAGDFTSVVIPDSVTEIGSGAFFGCRELTSIHISKYVTDIPNHQVFSCCTGLREITVDAENPNYQSIDGNLYTKDGKTLLYYALGKTDTNFTVPSGVEIIGFEAFGYSENLTHISIPSSVKSIGENAFRHMTAIEEINVAEENANYKSIDGTIFTEDGKILIKYGVGKDATAYVIPDGVETIAEEAFGGAASLENVTVPNSVTRADYWAFWDCDNLIYTEHENVCYLGNESNPYLVAVQGADYEITSCTIHPSTKVIVGGAFEYYYNLESVTIPEGGVTVIGERTFSYCESLKSITIPDGVTVIDMYAFEYCTALESIVIPESVVQLGDEEKWNPAFDGCTGLKSLTLLGGFTVFDNETIGDLGLRDPSSLETLELGGTVTYVDEVPLRNCTNLKNLILGSSITSIGSDAFSDCTSLESITILGSVTEIPNSMCEGCTSLTSITIPDGVTSIGNYAFSGCDSLTSITIPNSVTSIGYGAFSSCDTLAYTVYDNAKYLGNAANPYHALIEVTDSSISSCTIHENTKMIADDAFSDCTSLESITILGSVTEIPNSMCEGCTSLTSITIPDGVTSIGNYAFSCCDSLTSVTFAGTTEQWNTIAKESSWNRNSAITVVHCTDGDIEV